jgi:hypothetical protein
MARLHAGNVTALPIRPPTEIFRRQDGCNEFEGLCRYRVLRLGALAWLSRQLLFVASFADGVSHQTLR